MNAEFNIALLDVLVRQPNFDTTGWFVHQPTNGINVFHLVAISNSQQILKAILAYILPNVWSRVYTHNAGKLKFVFIGRNSENVIFRNEENMDNVKTMLMWRESLLHRTPLHLSAALYGTRNEVYRILLQLDNLFFNSSTANIKDSLGLRHSQYRDGADAYLIQSNVNNVENLKNVRDSVHFSKGNSKQIPKMEYVAHTTENQTFPFGQANITIYNAAVSVTKKT